MAGEIKSDVSELELKLSDVGKRLLMFPEDEEELGDLLSETEILLSDVGQAPTKSMLNCLQPIMDALVDKKLLAHSDVDMRVSVVSCISELIRIAAPIGPYDGKDDVMKEVFKRIVESFAKLDDISNCSFTRRISILDNFAKVRLCVMMLDLECEDLVLEMFHHFLNTIRPIHSKNILASMEDIMTVVLEESEEISSDLISCLLGSVRNENENSLPAARELGKKVIKKCESILKPYLKEFLKSRGESLRDYSVVVGSIYRKKSDNSKQNDANTSGKAMEVVSLSKSANKAPMAHQSNLDGSPKNTSGGKCGPAAKEVHEKTKRSRKLDGSLVGAKVKVWWPEDEQYYDGIIESYDSDTKKHKVLYTDGDVEILLLKNEQWDFIDGVTNEYLENEKAMMSPDAPAEEKPLLGADDKKVAVEVSVIRGRSGVLKVRRPIDSSPISKKSKSMKTLKDCTTKTDETSMKVGSNSNNSIKPRGSDDKEDAGHSGIENRRAALKTKRSEDNLTPSKKSKGIKFPSDGIAKTVETSMKAGSNLDSRKGVLKIKPTEDCSMLSEESKGSKALKPVVELETNCASGKEMYKVQQIDSASKVQLITGSALMEREASD